MKKALCILFLLIPFFVGAQSAEIDSINTLLKDKSIPDTTRARVLLSGFRALWKTDIKKAYPYAKEALALTEKINYPPALADAYHNMGLFYYLKADFNQALEYNYKALTIRQKLNDVRRMGDSWNNIGIMYNNQRDYDKSLEAYFKALEIRKQLGDQQGVGTALSNIGIVYLDKGEERKALEYFNQSIEIKEEIDDRVGQAYTYEEIAKIYAMQGKFNWAQDNYLKSIELMRGTDDPHTMASIYRNLGDLYINISKFEEAREQLAIALDLAEDFGDILQQQNITMSLSRLEEAEGNDKKALDYYKKSTVFQDSILNAEKAKALVEMRTKYEMDKMEEDNKLRLKEETLRRNIAIGGLGMAVILLIIFLYSNYQKTKTNNILTEQKDQISEQNTVLTQQKEEIEEKSRQITDSIRYAKDIQFAILPSPNRIKEAYPELFILNKPRDIVSGDFYWYSRNEGGKAYLAVADCTGHGVPGALMSMVFNDFFDYVINERGHLNVDSILREVHKSVRIALRQEETNNSDGMEAGLIALNMETKELEFAGAKRPIWYFQNGEFFEIKGDKRPIGGRQKEKERTFTRHVIDVSTPTTFYMFSDGYQDQFGGEKGKKFMSSTFKELLQSIHQQPMDEQKQLLKQAIHQWMNPNGTKVYEQLDDILVFGGRIL